MAYSEYHYNKKRKHYSKGVKKKNGKIDNIFLSTKKYVKKKRSFHGKKYVKKIKNIPLYHHPNQKDKTPVYLINEVYTDDEKVFARPLKNWKTHPFDRIFYKKIRKRKWK